VLAACIEITDKQGDDVLWYSESHMGIKDAYNSFILYSGHCSRRCLSPAIFFPACMYVCNLLKGHSSCNCMLQGSLIDSHTVKVFKPNKAQHDVANELLTRALLEQNVPSWFLESTAFKLM
jgi:hypothetical protein